MNIIKTKDVLDALDNAKTLLSATNNRIGQVIGAPGTGKTCTSEFLAQELDGIRMCCFQGMSKKDVLVQLSLKFGHENPCGSFGSLLNWLGTVVPNRLILIDEANHLRHPQLEVLRFLADESHAAILLFGTQLLEREFKDGRTGIYLAQLASRIGGKSVAFAPLTNDDEGLRQIAAYFIEPRFGKVVKKSVTQAFFKGCKGYWREAVELGNTCERLMKAQGFQEITTDIIQAAASFMTKGREIQA